MLVDTSNQYHLWAFDRTVAEDFSFMFRAVADGQPGQTPFDDRPDDCVDLSACAGVGDIAAKLPQLFNGKLPSIRVGS
jgi:hypothetical protein